MNATRLAVLAIALLAGGVAFFMAFGSAPEAPVQIVAPVEQKTIRVLVSRAALNRGDRLSADVLEWKEWPEKALSEMYLREGSVEMAELEKAVVRTMIVPGEPVIEAKIVRAGSAGMMAAVLEPGMRAITTRVSAETASGGFVLPGDRVDVYYTEPSRTSDETKISVLLEDVKVLAIDAIYTENPETAYIAGGMATLELSPGDAEFFTVKSNSRGKIALALRSVFEPTGPVNGRKRFDVQIVRYGRS